MSQETPRPDSNVDQTEFKVESFPRNPEQALRRLKAGNRRYVEGKLDHKTRTTDHEESLVTSQMPFAAILGCSDSRVPPEIVFDQGIGDIFVVRVAGNIVGESQMESINYSIDHLGSILVVVLGHQNCGAVDAVFHGHTEDIPEIAKLIEPAVKCSHSVKESIKRNVENMVHKLKKNKHYRKLIEEGKLKVVGGYYHLESGKVDFFDH